MKYLNIYFFFSKELVNLESNTREATIKIAALEERIFDDICKQVNFFFFLQKKKKKKKRKKFVF